MGSFYTGFGFNGEVEDVLGWAERLWLVVIGRTIL
jgi:hypothetical protein